jgi:hypothetical protein
MRQLVLHEQAMVMAVFGQTPVAQKRSSQHCSLSLREHSIDPELPSALPSCSPTVPCGSVGEVGLSPIQLGFVTGVTAREDKIYKQPRLLLSPAASDELLTRSNLAGRHF